MKTSYVALAKVAALTAILETAHSDGCRVELVVIQNLSEDASNPVIDLACTLPEQLFNNNQMVVNLSVSAIGNYSFDTESATLWFQGAFGGKKGEYFVPVGSVAGVLINGQLAWASQDFFVMNYEPTSNFEEEIKHQEEVTKIQQEVEGAGDNVVSLFGGKTRVH